MTEIFKLERDTIAALGLLAATYIRFDPSIKSGAGVSHALGFNVHCLVIDNVDGEVVALERNRIYADNNPLQHAEQLGVRAALATLQKKHPRPIDMSVEKYYKEALFMDRGVEPSDFFNRGCTLYNTFDPCGMCAVTLLVCYMKRIAFLFDDEKFGTVYEEMRKYFAGRESVKEALSLIEDGNDNPLKKAAVLTRALRAKVAALVKTKVPLVMTLDQCKNELEAATSLLIDTSEQHLFTEGEERKRNSNTLAGIKKFINLN